MTRLRLLGRCAVLSGALLAVGAAGAAGDPSACDVAGEAPDLVISDLFETKRFGSIGGITAFSVGTSTCNLGSCQASYAASTSRHPILAQNMYRLRGGQFEQIGQSGAAHRFIALSSSGCAATCIPVAAGHLGVGCRTNDLAVYAGAQTQLGPKSEVNPVNGVFPFPATGQSQMGDAIFKRLQVHDLDLDPARNLGALYFVEGVHVAEDDAAGGGQLDNASYRGVTVSTDGGMLDVALVGTTRSGSPALAAWAEHDPAVFLRSVDVPGDGRLWVASKATPLGDGVWHYEYAVENLGSHRSASRVRVSVPGGSGLTNAGFHDVDYHSGETIDGTDWAPALEPGPAHAVSWATVPFADDPAANALRWGTSYNFRFDARAAPTTATVVLGLFRPGSPSEVEADAVVPAFCDTDGLCKATENECSCPADCGTAATFELSCTDGLSDDCDGLVDCADPDCCAAPACAGLDDDRDGVPVCGDCDDSDTTAWSTPGEVTALSFSDSSTLTWMPPVDAGAALVLYEALQSPSPQGFLEAATCITEGASDTSAEVAETPAPGEAFFYLVRADNACPFRHGSLGTRSDGSERPGLACR